MFKKFSIRKWNHWNNVKMVLKHNAKEKKMDTKKRENELMEEEKRYYADIEIQWGVSFNARNKEEAIEYLKEQYKDDYNIDLHDDEITKLEEE